MRGRLIWRRLRRDPSAQVADVLAFVISHTTFLAAQDDETGRCPKSGIQVTSPQSLAPFLLAVLTEPVDLNARIGRSEAVLL